MAEMHNDDDFQSPRQRDRRKPSLYAGDKVRAAKKTGKRKVKQKKKTKNRKKRPRLSEQRIRAITRVVKKKSAEEKVKTKVKVRSRGE